MRNLEEERRRLLSSMGIVGTPISRKPGDGRMIATLHELSRAESKIGTLEEVDRRSRIRFLLSQVVALFNFKFEKD